VTDNRLTVILPCAGQGSRLGLASPKELFEIFPGTRLIDFSLQHLLTASQKTSIDISAAVVIRPGKSAVVEYVRQRLPGINVTAVMFNSHHQEWPGSVYSARDVFSRNNLVLLPDSYLSLVAPSREDNAVTMAHRGKPLVESVLEALSRYNVVFGCCQCRDWERLKTLGAVRIEKDIVTAFQDKPQPGEGPESFNGFWGCYGFTREYAKPLYDFLIHSLHHQPLPLSEQPFYPPGVIPVADYYDLGTWENIERFKRERGTVFNRLSLF
jgi:molybdopterin-guanine dinucleotide biosynthesis protein A